MTKITCPKCDGNSILPTEPYCSLCEGKGWIPHPTCNQCDYFYLEDLGFPSKVSKCRATGLVVNPLGYCHVHSELLEE